MGCKVASDRNEDMSASVSIAPGSELTDTSLQHLISVEASIFTQHRTRERSDERLRRMAKREMPRHEPCSQIDLSLSIERVKQGGVYFPNIRQVIELLAVVSRDAGGRHVEIAG